ncbi:hypothetical protein FJY94_02275 [Candidatus Kaiserbacteria bacterium]|nr:hypothetical protein [Candidatus Kaiserbacteria bacterium]
MGYRPVEFAVGEWYHCYSRTIDHSRPFEETLNTRRFLETLYLANSSKPIPNIPKLHARYQHEEIFRLPCENPLVAVGCYCIMPTHYHFLLQPLVENGISHYMQKVGIGFTKFYNEHNNRIGNLFVKPFRAKHIDTDQYLDRVVPYIHLNPVELFEAEWKRGVVRRPYSLVQDLRNYEQSSLFEHEGGVRPQSAILNLEALEQVRDNATDAVKLLADAAEYYQFLDLDI